MNPVKRPDDRNQNAMSVNIQKSATDAAPFLLCSGTLFYFDCDTFKLSQNTPYVSLLMLNGVHYLAVI
jgi:hypothetical protein